VERVVVELLRRRDLHDERVEVQDRPVRDVVDAAEVVRDERLCEPKSAGSSRRG